jgi:hypothetical protein
VTAEEIDRFTAPVCTYGCQSVLVQPSLVPARQGVYGWWFRALPPLVTADRCCSHESTKLLYVGMSPRRPAANGKAASRENLQKRIRYHYTGNAEGSTLRKTLGCLLADELGIRLRRVGSGKRMTFVEGEHALSRWMAEHAFVSWMVRDRPWELEDDLIATLSLPLNLQQNRHSSFYSKLSEVRARCVAEARALPVVPNPVR